MSIKTWLWFGLLVAFVAPLVSQAPASAHIRGKPAFLTVENSYVDYYEVKPAAGLSREYPQSMDVNYHLPGKAINFKIDRRLLSVSYDNANSMNFRWDFGDGSKAGNGAAVSHTYKNIGTYVVTVHGSLPGKPAKLIESTAMQIFPDESFTQVLYSMRVNGEEVRNNTQKISLEPNQPVTMSVVLNATSADRPVDSYEWDFGDGSTAEGQTVTHTYSKDFSIAFPAIRVRYNQTFYNDRQIWLQNPQAVIAAAPATAPPDNNSLIGGIRHSLQQKLSSIFKDGRINYGLAAFVLFFAIIAGAAHSLTPGHGKTILAALLIGRDENRYKDLAILTASITIAHTFVIYLVGFILLAMHASSSANSMLPFFERLSALLVVALALYLMYVGIQRIRHGHVHHHGHSHEIGDEHDHSHGHNYNQVSAAETGRPSRKRSTWSLIVAGTGGGIVPCIDALSLMLLAAGLGHVGFGLVLVVFFSLGLAGTIAALGLLVIAGKNRLVINKKVEQKIGLYAPLASGSIILLLAVFTLWP
jgi:ABC-type nickel/cobalt efflux system permease component RcnA/PKD repeat protein